MSRETPQYPLHPALLPYSCSNQEILPLRYGAGLPFSPAPLISSLLESGAACPLCPYHKGLQQLLYLHIHLGNECGYHYTLAG